MAGLDSERVSDAYCRTPHSALIRAMHIRTYELLLPLIASRRVLDVGCGTGYGCGILGRAASLVVGIDVCEGALREGAAKYGGDRTSFVLIGRDGATPLPFGDATFDAAVSIQVIEHLVEPGPYLAEITRVVRPGGSVFIATPHRLGRLWRGQRPWNRFHVREYDAAALKACLDVFLPGVLVWGLTTNREILVAELTRTKKLRLATFPVTNCLIPDPLRKWALGFVAQLHDSASGGIAFAAECVPAAEQVQFRIVDDTSENSLVLLAVWPNTAEIR